MKKGLMLSRELEELVRGVVYIAGRGFVWLHHLRLVLIIFKRSMT